MARISTTEANQALVTTGWTYISLHSADPSTTGANEITGYTRATIGGWTANTGAGTVSNTSAITINIPASTTVAYFGVWSASTAGTYYIGGALSPTVTTGATSGQISINANAIVISAT